MASLLDIDGNVDVPKRERNVFTRLVPQALRMLEHIPRPRSFDSTLGKRGSEQKELEEKTKLITAYIRDDWIRKQMRTNEEQFTAYKTMAIFVGTYNVNGKKPTSTGIREWLNMNNKFETTRKAVIIEFLGGSEKKTMPEIYVIGFQEIVDLNAANVIQESESEKRTASWSRMLGLFLNDIGKGTGVSYELVASKHLVGIAICVYVSNRHYKNVKDIQIVNCATGIFGVVGNKGGSSVRFRFYDSTLCFVCSHLAAHRGNVTGRNHDYATILSKTKFKDNLSEHGSDAMAYYMEAHRMKRIIVAQASMLMTPITLGIHKRGYLESLTMIL